MSAFSDKILSIVYGIGFGVAFGSVAAGFFRSYLIGFVVGAVVFVFARRFWINLKSNQRSVLNNGDQAIPSTMASRTDSTPWYRDPGFSYMQGNVYHNTSNDHRTTSFSRSDW